MNTIKVLDHGFVTLESHWGDEARIIDTARISTGAPLTVNGLTDKDKSLLYQLLANNHGTPLETVLFRIRVRAPIFIMRQWMRHRIGSFNEYSQRYRDPITDVYIPPEVDGTPYKIVMERNRLQTNFLVEDMNRNLEGIMQNEGFTGPLKVKTRARMREVLRNFVTVANYSEMIWTVNFRSLMNFLVLRQSEHAQQEMQDYANAVFKLVEETHPLLISTMTKVLEEQNGKCGSKCKCGGGKVPGTGQEGTGEVRHDNGKD